MEIFLLILSVAVGFTSYWIGKFMGVKEAFDKLEEEGKIISKYDLNKLKS